MKKIVVFFSLSIFFAFSYAQTPDWKWVRKGTSLGCNQGNAITSDNFENIYVVGEYQNSVVFNSTTGAIGLTSSGATDVFLTKYDSTGSLLWAKSAGGVSGDYGQDIAFKDGFLYITGYFGNIATFDTITLNAQSATNIFVAKYNMNGNVQWAKKYGGNLAMALPTCIDVNDNAIIVGGLFYDKFIYGIDTITSNDNGISEDLLIMKLDTLGNIQWVKAPGTVWRDYVYDVARDSLENIYVTGFFNGTITFDTISVTASNENMFLTKYDSSGNAVWVDHPVGVGINWGDGIKVYKSKIYVCGKTGWDCTFDTITLSFVGGTEDGFIARYNLNGNVEWAKKVATRGNDRLIDLSITSDGNIAVTGTIGDSLIYGNDTLFSLDARDLFVGKYDLNGNYIWMKRAGSTSPEYAIGVHADAFGNVYSTGHYENPADFGQYIITGFSCNDMYVGKINSNPPLGINESENKNSLTLSPNPTCGIFTIGMEDGTGQMEDGIKEIEIYNSIGELVFSDASTSLSMTVDLRSKSKGIYFIRAQTESGTVTGKVVIE